jgi:hypothetical protein
MTGVRIGELASQASVNPKTIRYYENIRLLPPPGRTPAGHRRYTGLGLHTPADVHYGHAPDMAVARQAVLADARARHPHRFGPIAAPKILDLPDTVWINNPKTDPNITQEASTDAA